jgi:hypothetical protein
MPSLIEVSVVLKSARSSLSLESGQKIRARLHSPPEKGKANEELIKLLANSLDLKREDVIIIRGHRSRKKTVSLNLTAEEIMRKLGPAK